jgi:superfamily I DNA/RNA helicase
MTLQETLYIELITSLISSNEKKLVNVIANFTESKEDAQAISHNMFNSNKIKLRAVNDVKMFTQLDSVSASLLTSNLYNALEEAQTFLENNLAFIGESNFKKLAILKDRLIRLKGTIGQRINKLNLKYEQEARVQTMTGHTSKGLEFDLVILIGCSESIIPSKKAILIEEERRIFYVSITRGIREVIIISPAKSDKGRTIGSESRFISEGDLTVTEVPFIDDFHVYREKSHPQGFLCHQD